MASAPSSPETPPNTNFTATSTPPLKISPATLPNPNNKRLLIGLSIGFALLSFVLILVIAFLVYFLHRVRKNKRHKSFGRIPLQVLGCGKVACGLRSEGGSVTGGGEREKDTQW
ncbi:hypothetical protein JHK85_017598 [Glycine max]|nr:hypothetical protein JHK87_017104 [Glycine soja]KAG5021256.1 hypothetical protein JHK85_017598 [Glycine max]